MGLLSKIFGREAPVEPGRVPGQGLVMKQDEECYSDVEGVLIEEKTTRKRIRGGSVGLSYRVTDRFSIRGNRFQGEIVPETAMKAVAIGRLYITSNRVVFRGNKKSFNLALTSIMAVETFADAVRLTSERGGKPHIVQFADAASADRVREVLAAIFGGDEE